MPTIGYDALMNIPDELRYTSDHEWARAEEIGIRMGITDFAQEALGDVVFVDLPKPGEEFEKGAKIGEVESTKSVSEVYSPIAGKVVVVNSSLSDSPEIINSDPYGEGWFCVIAPRDEKAFEELLSASKYEELTDE
ncbi:MAG TPA: glycine cleavage system protein GcvH [Acidimicrobiales bacterium]|nr:glycine cleavage system protein GcvH [Acidimicrobiales bacterium]